MSCFCIVDHCLESIHIWSAKDQSKYNNPFANYIQVATPKNVDQDRVAMVKSIVQKFSSEPLKSRLKIEKVNELHYEFIAFSNPKTGMAKTYKGRTFTEGDQLYKELTGSASENIIQSLKLEKPMSINNMAS
ncbi:MAG: hypothetical protein IPI15_05865 [Saprospiraceae bacterium]|uniref:hypothetical protein n=1 Tax=Candidatus Brachybacter algidus TaxID=2982024 RepID=UPI0025799299|nr:hypothetical protein [Candidatus Brachybacter algidus]MBK7603100.1 hypothetical protein [Candidatus Brachybacter algidus]